MADRPAQSEVRSAWRGQRRGEIAQGAAQAFFQHRVVEGHGEQIPDRRFALDRQRQEMR